MRLRYAVASALCLAVAANGATNASDIGSIDSTALDAVVGEAMEAFDIPGVAVAVISGGEVVHLRGYGVREAGGRLVLKFSHTDNLEGSLKHYRNADAFVRFTVGFDGHVDGMTMRAVSGRTDFSFDFHDLDFVKVAADD